MGLFDRLRGKPTPQDFASMIMRAIKKAGESSGLRYDPEEFRILRLDGGKVIGVLNLSNIYSIYLDTPRRDRAELFRRFIRTALSVKRELPDDFESAKPDLRLKLWPRAAVEKLRLKALIDGDRERLDPPHVPLGEHVLACLAYDWPESTQSIASKDLEQWGVTLYEAFEAARENLAATTETYAKMGDHLITFMSGDSYDPGRILMIDKIRDEGLRGRPVAMIPNRDIAHVTGEEDETGIHIMTELAMKGLGQAYPLSACPLVLDDDTWTDWTPPDDHPCRDALHAMMLRWIGPEYAEQKRLLEALHAKQGESVFVASLSAMSRKDEPNLDKIISYCVWSNGVDTLLPEADYVLLMKSPEGPPAAIGRWDRVMEVAGSLIHRTEHYPPRYRVSEFPDDRALAEIGILDF